MRTREIENTLNIGALNEAAQQTIKIELVKANALLADDHSMQALAHLTTQAFTHHNPTIAIAYEQSEKKSEFLRLSDEQLFDSVRQIAIAQNVNDSDGILLLARDTSKPGNPIIGMISGVRNGYPHPSHEYMDKLFSSDCGLGGAIGQAFGPVMHEFHMEKMNAFTNVFMLGMVAVHPDYMKQGVASDLSRLLFTELKASYDGMFSIITSPKAKGLLMKMMESQADNNEVALINLQQGGVSHFFGLGFNARGMATFNAFNTTCRNTIVADVETATKDQDATITSSLKK
jgi:ribosomal protein S18 acetylase RimI-like enzyme